MMPTNARSRSRMIQKTRLALRSLLVLALSCLLHLLVLQAATGHFGKPGAVTNAVPVMTALVPTIPSAVLESPPQAESQQVREGTLEKPLPSLKKRRVVKAAPPTIMPPQLPDVDSQISNDHLAQSDVVPENDVLPPTAAGGLVKPPTVVEQEISSAPPSPTQYRIDLPPSAILSYEVRYSTKGSITVGSSVIDWQADKTGYVIGGAINKFGFALSSFRSEGGLDDAGLAPTLYWEKNLRRPEMRTFFQRGATQAISFSANSSSDVPLVPGVQDRASILWQLAGIGRAKDEQFFTGATLDILVAGVRDAQRWQITIQGEEIIDIESGKERAWHLVREGNSATKDKRIDIWLAPERQWHPVKLRYTEANGDYLDLSLASIK